jgi:hypothetical protein
MPGPALALSTVRKHFLAPPRNLAQKTDAPSQSGPAAHKSNRHFTECMSGCVTDRIDFRFDNAPA